MSVSPVQLDATGSRKKARFVHIDDRYCCVGYHKRLSVQNRAPGVPILDTPLLRRFPLLII